MFVCSALTMVLFMHGPLVPASLLLACLLWVSMSFVAAIHADCGQLMMQVAGVVRPHCHNAATLVK